MLFSTRLSLSLSLSPLSRMSRMKDDDEMRADNNEQRTTYTHVLPPSTSYTHRLNVFVSQPVSVCKGFLSSRARFWSIIVHFCRMYKICICSFFHYTHTHLSYTPPPPLFFIFFFAPHSLSSLLISCVRKSECEKFVSCSCVCYDEHQFTRWHDDIKQLCCYRCCCCYYQPPPEFFFTPVVVSYVRRDPSSCVVEHVSLSKKVYVKWTRRAMCVREREDLENLFSQQEWELLLCERCSTHSVSAQ